MKKYRTFAREFKINNNYMKKILLTTFCVLTAFCAMAQSKKTYTEPLIVTINGLDSDPQDASVVVVDNGNGTINFELQNFFLATGGESMPVGNISIENLPVTKGEDGLDYITFNGTITIQPGDMEGVNVWMGPLLGDIPMNLQGKMNDEKLYVTIDIDMQETIHQICYVQLGTDDFSAASKLGDLNGDGMVDIADAVTVLNIMAAGEYNADADVNHDQTVDIADFVTILNIMAAQ